MSDDSAGRKGYVAPLPKRSGRTLMISRPLNGLTSVFRRAQAGASFAIVSAAQPPKIVSGRAQPRGQDDSLARWIAYRPANERSFAPALD